MVQTSDTIKTQCYLFLHRYKLLKENGQRDPNLLFIIILLI